MKKLLLYTLSVLALVVPQILNAQQLVPYYTFSQTTGTYSPISGGTVLASGTGLDDQRYLVNLPFTFNVNGTNYTQAFVSINGYLSFDTDPGNNQYWIIQSTSNGYAAVAGFAANLASLNSTTELQYITSGVAPNRTFIIQWKNFGYPSSTALTANFQIRLNESSNTVVTSYGTTTLTGASSQISVQVGLRGTSNATFFCRDGIWSSTSAGTINNDNILTTPSNLPASGLTYTFTPPTCVTPTNQPTALVLNPNTTSVNVSYTAASPAVDKYLVVRTPNVPLNTTPVNGTTYISGNALGNGTVVYAGSSTSFTNSSLTQSTYYTYTVFAYDELCVGGPAYKATTPLTGTVRTNGPDRYTWIATSGSGSWTTPGNWSPARTNPFSADTLVFGNGGTPAVTGVPSQTVALIEILNNTAVEFTSVSTTNNLTVNGGNFLIEAGSAATLKSGIQLKFASGGTQEKGFINGVLNLGNNSTYDAIYGQTIVKGIVNDTGSNAEFNTSCTGTCSSIIFDNNSYYNHGRNGGNIPYAYYDAGSTVNITGITTTAPSNISGQVFGNYNWNCPLQAANIVVTTVIDTIKGDLTIVNTSTYAVRLTAGTFGEIKILGNFEQKAGTFQISGTSLLKVSGNVFLIGGVLDLSSASMGGITLRVAKDLLQAGAHTIARSGSAAGGILFEGNAKQQVVIGGSFTAVSTNYHLKNPAGANLTGNLPMTGSNMITKGTWSGTGSFSYASGGTLRYEQAVTQSTTSVEWPATGGPTTVTLDLSGIKPNNRLYLHESRSVNTFYLDDGVLVLGANDLDVGTIPNSFATYDDNSTNMVAADSTGQLIRTIPSTSAAITTVFPIGSIKDSAVWSGVHLIMTNNTTARKIGMRSIDSKHPNEPSATDYMNLHWAITDNGGSAPCSYYMNCYYDTAQIVGNRNIQLSRWNGSSWNGFSGSLYYNNLFYVYALSNMKDTLSVPASPLNGSSYTARVVPPSTTYSWTGAIDMDYQKPGNWTPNRTIRAYTDILQFNNSNIDTVKNVIPETITKLLITNYTTVIYQLSYPGPNAAQRYVIHGDFDKTTPDLNIDSGSTMLVNSFLFALALEYNIANHAASGRIAGRFELVNTGTTTNVALWESGITTVTSSGTIAAGTTNAFPNNAAFKGTPTTLIVDGTYEHNYSTVSGTLPDATWGVGSTVKILGFTTATQFTMPSNVNLYNLTYDCPNQTSLQNWDDDMPVRVDGTLKVISTGTGTWRWWGSLGINLFINNYIQTGGNVDIGAGLNPSTYQFNFAGQFSQTGGTFFTSTSGTTKPTLVFNGTQGRQDVNFHNNSPAGINTYVISNPNGINLTGTGTLTGNFDILNNGTVKILSSAPYPIKSNLSFAYGSNATLYYGAKSNLIADTVVFPSNNGPTSLTLDIATGNRIKIPFNRTVGGTLAMYSGDINMGPDTLTIGTSSSTPGLLTYTSGDILLTSGAIKRWYGVTGLPTAPGTGVGYYPISFNGSDRDVYVYFSTPTALSSGGSVTISHNDITGITTGLSVTDAPLTLNSRSNSSWSVIPADGITLSSSSVGLKINCYDLFTVNTPANLRLMKANSVVGTAVNGGVIYAQRNGLSLTDLANGAFYIGSDGTNMGDIFISVADGNWKNGSTWDKGIQPTTGSTVLIRAGDTVTIDTNTHAIKMLTVHNNGGLLVNDSTFLADSTIFNYGYVSLTKGKIVLGPAGGGKSPFYNLGTLSVNSGNLNINGSFRSYAGSKLKQTGGDITIDGNANSVAANSVPVNVHICHIATDSVIATAGNITIVDPHVLTTWRAFYSDGSNAVFGKNHNLIFGDGVSTTPGSTNAFVFSPSSTQLGNVVVKGSPSGAYRMVNVSSATSLNNLVLQNSNAEYDMNGYNLKVLGDITAGAGTQLLATSTIEFASDQPQMVSGAGLTGQSFYGLHLNNSSASGVTFAIGDFSYTNTLAFTKGKLNIGSATITKTGSHYTVNSSGTNTGWVVGKYSQRAYAETLFFPVGDANTYAPATVTIPTGGVSGTGYIRASTVAGDHTNILTSNINPLKSVNRQYIIDTTGTVNFTANPASATFNWNVTDVDPGANATGFIAQSYKNNTWSSYTTTLTTPTTITINGIGNNIPGTYQAGQVGIAPLITQQPVSQNICSGTNTAFTVGVSMASSYKWQVNTGSSWTDIQPGLPYSGINTTTLSIINAPLSINGYQYRCKAYNVSDSIASNAATLNVGLTSAPAITISASTGNTICASTTVTFTASVANGGITPSFQWYKNGVNVGSSSSTYIINSLADQDSITCLLTSSSGCASPATATSNYIKMTVNPTAAPSVTVTANPGNTICAGISVTFTAAATNAGNTPSYQWKKNSVSVGSNSATYTDNALINGDQVSCIVTSSHNCATPSTATNGITMTVNPIPTPSVAISANTGTTVCAGTSVTFTATPTNGGASPSYQWKVNSNNAGTNSNMFSTSSLSNNDVVTCALTSNATCATPTTAISTGITMTINPTVTPSVAISANPAGAICAGTSVTFTATPTNGGTTPAYQWKVNGVNAGANSTSFTTTGLNNSDVVTCTMNSNAVCPTPASVTSSGITMTVNPILTPSVSVTASPGNTICAGTSVTFTASPVNGGASPSYQWKVNSSNVGTNSVNYTSTGLNNNDVVTCVITSNASCISTTSATSTGITMTVDPLLIPTVTISANTGTTVCAGTSVTFTAAPTNGGASPSYQWKVNGNNAGTNSNTFSTSSLSNNDVVTCVLTSNATCATPATATSTGITMTVNPTITPSVAISANPTGAICAGTSVTFTATPTNGGTTPAYQWKVNGVNAGTNSTTFVTNNLSNNDAITVTMTSNAVCPTPASVTSSGITMTVNPPLTPSVSVTTSPGNTICAGTSVTFTASQVNGGASPSYQWKVNGSNVGTNSTTYTSTSLNNNDVVTCVMTSSATCITATSATSAGSTMTVNPLLTPSATISANPGVNAGPYTPITFSATVVNGGTIPGYQWKKNGVNIPGATNSTYVGTTVKDLAAGDKVSVKITSNAVCAQPTDASSSDLTIAVNLAVETVLANNAFELFPNPNKGSFTIKGNLGLITSKELSIEILNGLGQTVYSVQIPTTQGEINIDVNMPHFAADGLYILRVVGGEKIVKAPFVLQR